VNEDQIQNSSSLK